MGRKVLIIGATQGTGLELTRLLLEKGDSIRAFARNENKLREHFSGDEVEAVIGDLQNAEGMADAVRGVDHIVFTAGVTKRPCKEQLIIDTEFEGMKRVLSAAKSDGFSGRFVFLSSIGVVSESWASKLLNKVKGNALYWRKRMEDEIVASGFPFTIARAGFLMNSNRGLDSVGLGQTELPLLMRYRIGRNDVARLFVAALESEDAANKIFDAVWGKDEQPSIEKQFESLV